MSDNGQTSVDERAKHIPAAIKPGFVLPVLQEEITVFEERAQKFRIGDEVDEDFRMFRLHHGIYGQRQEDNQMVRVKLPYGGVTADQMDALAEVSEKYSALHRGHITTRENFQFHFVNLDDSAEVMRIIGEAGLTTREACAHTVRNVTGCPFAGVCSDEVFDATPYLVAYARTMIRNPICQRLPRKFKTSFSSCASDCAGSPFHDLGFVPRTQTDAQGNVVRGFELRVGGGFSTMPRRADTVWEFARADDGEYIRVAEAILRVFDREGDQPGLLRKNLNKARIKFLLHKIGVEEFRRKVVAELAGDWAQEPLEMAALLALAPEGPTEGELEPLSDLPEAYERWRQTNAREQKQAGYYTAAVTVPIGNINTAQFRALARIMRDYSGGNGRTNQNQNLILRWVRADALPHLYRELLAIGLGAPDAGLLADVVACPGADSCKMAITASNQAGYAMREAMMAYDYADPDIQTETSKISGCPNGCGLHNIGGIGLQGSSYKVGGHEVPCYDMFLGGGGMQDVEHWATRVTRIPAKRVPEAINRVFEVYQRERQQGESFVAYIERVGAKSLEPHLEEFKWVEELTKALPMYMDWGQSGIFEVIRGEGECAAGAMPMIHPTALATGD